MSQSRCVRCRRDGARSELGHHSSGQDLAGPSSARNPHLISTESQRRREGSCDVDCADDCGMKRRKEEEAGKEEADEETSRGSRFPSVGLLRKQSSLSLSPSPLDTESQSTVSSRRKVLLKEEFQQIKGSFRRQCSSVSKGSERKREDREARMKLEYYNWDKWLSRRNGKLMPRLTKREFRTFWSWYSSRREVNGAEQEETGGIRLDRAADDFLKIGLFDTRPDAVAFLKDVDNDHSGFVSFRELMEALGNTRNSDQVECMRKFVKSLLTKEDRKKTSRDTKCKVNKIPGGHILPKIKASKAARVL